MKTKQVTTILLASLLVTFYFQEAESTFHLIHGKLKLLKWLKAGIVAKALLSHHKKIIPIPIPIITKTLHSDHHHHHHYDHYEGHHGYDYGHHGGYGYHHQPVIYHSTGWYLDKHGHGWH